MEEKTVKYSEFIALYKNNQFRDIDREANSQKFYLLRSLSKKATLKKLCNKYNTEENLDDILDNENITSAQLVKYIRKQFIPKSEKEIKTIERELNKMQYFDWGGSSGNSLEKNLVNNVIKKYQNYNDVIQALNGPVQRSVYGYTLNSWYNHWSSIMIEDIFNANPNVLPTIDLVEKIDFYIHNVPFDLKVTYFPEDLMKEKIGEILKLNFGKKSELACTKDVCKTLKIEIPNDMNARSLTICLQNLLRESNDDRAKEFMDKLLEIKNDIYNYYIENPNELIIWLYENQGERRFDAANRFYIVLIDRANPHDSWKLKRNGNLLKDKINEKINAFDENNLNEIEFCWNKDEKKYKCYSELLFIIK